MYIGVIRVYLFEAEGLELRVPHLRDAGTQ